MIPKLELFLHDLAVALRSLARAKGFGDYRGVDVGAGHWSETRPFLAWCAGCCCVRWSIATRVA